MKKRTNESMVFLTGLLAIAISTSLSLPAPVKHAAPHPQPTTPTDTSTPVMFSVVAAGLHGGVAGQVNYVLRSSGELAALWKMLPDATVMPNVDFSKKDVLAFFAGQEPNPGYTVLIKGVEDVGDERVVSITLSQPGANCIEPQVVASPYQIVVVPKTALSYTHEETKVVQNCD